MTTPFIGHAHEIGGSSISAADFGFCRAVIEAGIEPSMTTTAADSRASLNAMKPSKDPHHVTAVEGFEGF
jgi:hypothetical protein